jgi:hypothetical protein
MALSHVSEARPFGRLRAGYGAPIHLSSCQMWATRLKRSPDLQRLLERLCFPMSQRNPATDGMLQGPLVNNVKSAWRRGNRVHGSADGSSCKRRYEELSKDRRLTEDFVVEIEAGYQHAHAFPDAARGPGIGRSFATNSCTPLRRSASICATNSKIMGTAC